MAKNWIAGAVKHPGALTKKATKAGMSPMGFAAEHKGDSGTTGRQARLAITLGKLRSHLPKGTPLTPSGDLGVRRDAENRAVGGFTEGRALNATTALPMRSKPTGLTGGGTVK